MPKDPERITVEQVRDALSVMGIDRDVTDLESVSIEVDKVVIVRRRRAEDGGFLLTRAYGGSLATVATEVPLVGE